MYSKKLAKNRFCSEKWLEKRQNSFLFSNNFILPYAHNGPATWTSLVACHRNQRVNVTVTHRYHCCWMSHQGRSHRTIGRCLRGFHRAIEFFANKPKKCLVFVLKRHSVNDIHRETRGSDTQVTEAERRRQKFLFTFLASLTIARNIAVLVVCYWC